MGKQKITKELLIQNGFEIKDDCYIKDGINYCIMNGLLVNISTGYIVRNYKWNKTT